MNPEAFITGIEELIKRDRDLAKIIDNLGYPPQWQREPGFPTLMRIILEQQVSLASAKATFDRLNNTVEKLTPASFLSLDDVALKTIGFSRQKTCYGRELARTIVDKQLNLNSLAQLDDEEVRAKLTSIKGIGDWTVDMYLMMALQRQDIFPSKDLAVVIAVKEIKDLSTRPKKAELESIARLWQPYRAIATQILWHYYLNRN
ncbi:DNA-3-methyladenine glycosylase 2 family protein [Waterburya agarophytonicola K14]|uniref:DNA-3-methyladenine glycosylase II n=1 Tax=Waterburya agarophytonicola KI4 TaxID=2874699 RepID=A0A964BPB3_9CYAN|nr:DNA-3-methyladenine glycosylase 2 family protein [Waterburya agarophytonicola]MCC0175430.1 DNA-3-methyladenine glycosylase 2 family protein [Waterburya agarophytonicola KI4]